jgi:hypothetical protein
MVSCVERIGFCLRDYWESNTPLYPNRWSSRHNVLVALRLRIILLSRSLEEGVSASNLLKKTVKFEFIFLVVQTKLLETIYI